MCRSRGRRRRCRCTLVSRTHLFAPTHGKPQNVMRPRFSVRWQCTLQRYASLTNCAEIHAGHPKYTKDTCRQDRSRGQEAAPLPWRCCAPPPSGSSRRRISFGAGRAVGERECCQPKICSTQLVPMHATPTCYRNIRLQLGEADIMARKLWTPCQTTTPWMEHGRNKQA